MFYVQLKLNRKDNSKKLHPLIHKGIFQLFWNFQCDLKIFVSVKILCVRYCASGVVGLFYKCLCAFCFRGRSAQSVLNRCSLNVGEFQYSSATGWDRVCAQSQKIKIQISIPFVRHAAFLANKISAMSILALVMIQIESVKYQLSFKVYRSSLCMIGRFLWLFFVSNVRPTCARRFVIAPWASVTDRASELPLVVRGLERVVDWMSDILLSGPVADILLCKCLSNLLCVLNYAPKQLTCN